jgi:hypothetical protein
MVWRNNKRWKSACTLRPRRQGELAWLGRRLDWLVAQVTKYRDGWRCQRCGKRLFQHDAHCAHVLPKSAGILLRWDQHNTILLCTQDHLPWAHLHPAEFRQWFQAKFPERFAYLQDRRRQHARFDEQARRTLIAVLERELRRLGGWP